MSERMRQDKRQNTRQEEQQIPQRPQPMKYNPRLVFTDPDEFFLELLTEQSETM